MIIVAFCIFVIWRIIKRMKLDIGSLLRGETDVIEFEFDLAAEAMGDVEFSKDAHVVGKVTDNGGYIQLHLNAEVPFITQCARCMDEVRDIFKTEMTLTVAAEGTVSDEELEENMDEYAIVTNGCIDIDEQVREALILDFPMRFLCREDCPGLCPICGKKKADGDCGCSDKKEVDPRLAVLQSIIDQLDE